MKTKILLKARWLLCGLLAVFLTTNVWAENPYLSADFTAKTTGSSAYNSTWTYGSFSITNGANNNKGWAYIKFGGKSGTISTANPCYVVSPKVEKAIASIDVITNSGNLTAGSVNGWGVYVYSDAEMTTEIDHVTGGAMTKKTAETLTLTPSDSEDSWPKNSYYKVYFDLANTTTTNGIVWVDKINWYEYVEGGVATLESISFSGGLSKTSYSSDDHIDLSGLTATGSYSDVSTSDITNEVTWTVSADGTNYVSPEALTLTAGMTQIYVKATLGDISATTIINDLTVTQALPKSTLTFTAKCEGSGTADDNVTWTVISDGTESTYDSSKGIHYGTNSASVQYIKLSTSGIAGTIRKIVVNTSAASGVTATASVTVGGAAFGGEAQTIGTDATDYTFSGSAIGAIEVTVTKESSATKALYVKSVVVTYETTPYVAVEPASLTFSAKQNVAVEAQTFTLTGAYLENGLTLTASAGFAVNPTTLTAETAMTSGGVTVTVTPATPTAATSPVTGTVTISGTDLSEDVTVSLSMTVTATYAVQVAVNDGSMGSATINGGTATVYATDDDIINLVATAASGHEFVKWTVSDEDIILDNEDDASTTAIAGAAGTITANFQLQQCTGLAAPTLDEITKTYNSATITWNAVTNAEGYYVYVYEDAEHTTEKASYLVTDGTSFEVNNLAANTTYYYTVMAAGDGSTYCDENNPLLSGSFTTNDYPSVNVTYSENGVSREPVSQKIMTAFALPTSVTNNVGGKVFVGWSTVELAVASAAQPASNYYAKGANFTIENNAAITLYAVYADETPGVASAVFTETFANATGTAGWSGNSAAGTIAYDNEGWVADKANGNDGSAKFGASSAQGYATTPEISIDGSATLTFKSGAWSGDKTTGGLVLSIEKGTATLTPSTIDLTDGEWADNKVAITDAAGPIKIKFSAAQASKNRFFLDDVVVSVAGAATYSNYVTSGVVKPATPTFDVEADTYNEHKLIIVETATDGATIYYTLDGSDPTDGTNSNRKVYDADSGVELEECGEYQLKAAAFKNDVYSDVASAEYTILLSTANTLVTAYTPAEAIAIYDGDCDKSEKVYVRGVVTSATMETSSSTSAADYKDKAYNVYVKGIGTDGSVTFEFYCMFKDEKNTAFSSGDIQTGDTVTAYGTLAKSNSTYEFSAGCYMVEYKKFMIEKVSINNTLETAYTVAAAIAKIDDATSDLQNSTEVYVKGVVTSTNNSKTIVIHDADAENSFQFYKADYGTFAVGENDTIICKGSILKHNSTYEMAEGGEVVSVKAYVSSVEPPVAQTVAVVAKCGDKYYAMSTTVSKSATAYEVTFNESGAVVIPQTLGKAAITWYMTDTENGITLQDSNGKYLTGGSSTDLSLGTASFEWVWSAGNNCYINGTSGTRTFLYQTGQGFKNYAYSNISKAGYSEASFIVTGIAESVAVEVDANVSDLPDDADVTVGEDVKLTIDVDKELGEMHIDNGGTVEIADGKTLTVQNLFLSSNRADSVSSQILGANGNNIALATGGDVFFDITLGKEGTSEQWHAFTVPFPVDVLNGIYDTLGNKLTNEVNYAIMVYHGDIRANGQYGWKKYRGVLVPGVFYVMATDGDRDTYRMKMRSGASVFAGNSMTYTAYSGSGAVTDKGWNGIGNPSLCYGTVALMVSVLNPETYEFVTYAASACNFVVGTPFFYQADADGTMTMATENKPYYAPQMRGTESVIEDMKVYLGNAAHTDYIYVSANEEAASSYEIGKDLVRMTMTNTPSVPRICAAAYGNKLSAINTPLVSGEAVVNLSLYAPEAGTYTLRVDEVADYNVYLMRGSELVWNMSNGQYEAELVKGDNTEYSILLRRNAPSVATGMDIITAEDKVEKVILNGALYLIRDGKVYDSTGKAVR